METEELVRAIKRQFGDENGAQIDDDDIWRWINEGQFQIARRTGDVESSQSIPLTVSGSAYNHKYDLSTDFFKFKTVELDGKALQKLSIEQLYGMYPSLDVPNLSGGFPKFCAAAKLGTNQYRIVLAPIPGQAGTLTILYARRPPIINSTSSSLSLPEEHHNTLLTWCLSKAKQLDGDDEASLALAAQYRSEVQDDVHDAKHKDEDTYPIIRASPEDVWY